MVEEQQSSHFRAPLDIAISDTHHDAAAALNDHVTGEASAELSDMLSGASPMERCC